MENPDRVTYFAETDYRENRTPFGIKAKDRTRHMYVIGKTGMGKSTLLENMAAQDIQNGEGFAFIDPHGSAVEKILSYIPPERANDVVYFAPFDLNYPVAFNIMEDVGYDKRHLVANGLMSAFKKIWVDAWSARMEYILNNCLLALLEYPDSTLLSVNRMLVDKNYRKKVVENISDPSVRSFWVDEFAKYTDRYTQEATPAIQNKIGQFTSNPLIRNIVGQSKSSFDIREIMDNKKILIMNLSKGQMGEQNANLIGSMLVTKIYLAAMSRADISEDQLASLPNFYFYVDEFQSFANESFADILSEARKYKLNLTIAHQYIEQMPEEVRAAVFGNVGTMITFRVGSYDAEIFEKEFAPRFLGQDIVNLGFAQIYLRLMINGIGSQPFSAVTLPPIELPPFSYYDEIIQKSRARYAQPREVVEAQIKDWHGGDGGFKNENTNDHSRNNSGSSNAKNANTAGRQSRREDTRRTPNNNQAQSRNDSSGPPFQTRQAPPAPQNHQNAQFQAPSQQTNYDPWAGKQFAPSQAEQFPQQQPPQFSQNQQYAQSEKNNFENTRHSDTSNTSQNLNQPNPNNRENHNFRNNNQTNNQGASREQEKHAENNPHTQQSKPVRNTPKETLSLNDLKRKNNNEPKQKKKESPLKRALAEAIAMHEEDDKNNEPSQTNEKNKTFSPSRETNEKKKTNEQPAPPVNKKSEDSHTQERTKEHKRPEAPEHEISEDVLKRILKVEEEEYRHHL
jgi:hypothetical protein